MNDSGVLPILLIIILVLVGVAILVGGFILIAFTTKTVLTILFVGAGLYLLFRPRILSGISSKYRIFVPFGLIVLGIAMYAGVFSGW